MFNALKGQKQIAELQKSNTEWATKHADLEKKLVEAQDTIGNFMVEKETFTKQIEAQKADYEKQVSTLKAEIEATKNSVVKEATAQLASIGIPEGTVKEEMPKTEKSTNQNFKVISHIPKK